MANTYTQIHIQFVFAVKYRYGTINLVWREELYKYITGIIQNNNHKLIAINGMLDHVHILIGVRPNQSISELMQVIKTNSSKWINENGFVKGKFEWQEGYGAFSYGKSQVNDVIEYIKISKYIIVRNHLERNIFNSFRNLKLIMMKNTYLKI